MSKQTPGPWEAEHRKSEPPSVADDPGYWTIDGQVLADKWGPVADTLNRHHCISPDEDRANAILIAAAPDLLAALTFIVSQLREPGNAPHTLGAYIHGAGFAMAEKAIAKATL